MSAERVAACLADYMVAVQAEEKARAQYEGHSWDYSGAALIEARQRASAMFESALNEHIYDCIESATGARP